jgi:hypothetical protein
LAPIVSVTSIADLMTILIQQAATTKWLAQKLGLFRRARELFAGLPSSPCCLERSWESGKSRKNSWHAIVELTVIISS